MVNSTICVWEFLLFLIFASVVFFLFIFFIIAFSVSQKLFWGKKKDYEGIVTINIFPILGKFYFLQN